MNFWFRKKKNIFLNKTKEKSVEVDKLEDRI